MNPDALDALSLMAVNVAAAPRVYVVLVGSGVSRPARIPTGWEIVTELVARYAEGMQDDVDLEEVRSDPESWWSEHGEGELGYSSLLQSLAPTPAARRELIRRFIEPGGDELDGDARTPTAAHRALAKLVAGGWIDLILTTNFDRLIETALEAEGVQPQVVASPADIAGMQPLNHDGVTVVKLHGDYLSPNTLNTADELAAYPTELDELLDEVLDRYGLIVCGWSADWDQALVTAINRATSRRYPLYWGQRSSTGAAARRVLEARAGTRVPATDADELFGELLERVEAIDRLGYSPISIDIALQRLKRYLPNPIRRIDLDDLVDRYTREFVHGMARDLDLQPSNQDPASWLPLLERYRDNALPLVRLVAHGVHHDDRQDHTDLWVRTIERMMAVASSPQGNYNQTARSMGHYPALMALHVLGLVTMLAGRDDQFLALHLKPTYRPDRRDPIPAVAALNCNQVMLPEVANRLVAARNGDEQPRKWHWPVINLLAQDLADIVAEFVDDTETPRLKAAETARDYRTALLQQDLIDAGTMAIDRASADGYFNSHGNPDGAVEAFGRDLQDDEIATLWIDTIQSASLEDLQTSMHDTIAKYQRWF